MTRQAKKMTIGDAINQITAYLMHTARRPSRATCSPEDWDELAKSMERHIRFASYEDLKRQILDGEIQIMGVWIKKQEGASKGVLTFNE